MENKVNPKKTQPKITGSLALRVLFLSVIILVVPLFFHTIVSYRHEYESSKKELFQELKILAKGREYLIERMRTFQISALAVLEDQISKDMSFQELDEYLQEAASKLRVSKIFYVEDNQYGELVCKASSTGCLIGADYSAVKSFLTSDDFSYVTFSPHLDKSYLFVGKTMRREGALGAMIIASPAHSLVKGLAEIESPYPLNLSLVTKKGLVVASSDSNFQSKTLNSQKKGHDEIFIERVAGVPDGYKLAHAKGHDLAIKIPINDLNVNLLLDVSIKKIHEPQLKGYFKIVLLLLFFILIIGGGLAFILALRFAKPLKQLFSVVGQVGKGDFSVRYQADPLGFELNTLGAEFNQMIEDLLHHQKEIASERFQKEKYSQELQIGHDIQKSILTVSAPSAHDLEVASKYLPAKEVSGDYYDLFPLSETKILITIADIAGKGISACLYSLSLRSMLRSFAGEFELEEALKKANQLFCSDTGDTGMFATVWVGIFDQKTKELSYVNAGHHPTLLLRKGKVNELEGSGLAIGIQEETSYSSKKVQLESNDFLLLYTDGAIEMTNSKAEFFGKKRLIDNLGEVEGKATGEIVDGLSSAIDLFAEKTEQDDDVTLLGLKVL